MPCRYYPPADLDDLEELAESAGPEHQKAALQIVADIFNVSRLPYALMGGMNFYLRGSGRTTQDVDLAVTGAQSLEATLNLLNDDDRITRPRNKMAWLSGVARIFVLVGNQQVQIDLKWQRGEGHGMPTDLEAATELIQIRAGRSHIRFLAIGPLVKAKFQSYGRGFRGDFTDLRFVCTSQRYMAAVRQMAGEINLNKRIAFLEEIIRREPEDEAAVRYALRLDRAPGSEEQSRHGRGNGGTGAGAGTGTGTRTSTSGPTSRTGAATGSRSTGQGEASRRTTTGRAEDSLTSRMQRLRFDAPPEDPRAADRRAVDPRAADYRATDRRADGYRAADYRPSDRRADDYRAADRRADEYRTADHHRAAPQQRTTTSTRHATHRGDEGRVSHSSRTTDRYRGERERRY